MNCPVALQCAEQDDAYSPACSHLSLAELIDHIVHQHHAYLRRELPELGRLAHRCDAASPQKPGAIGDLRGILAALTQELLQHMHKEEVVLFPWIKQLEASGIAYAPHCGTIAAPIQIMEREHDFANDALSQLHQLTNGYVPDGDCSIVYCSLLNGLKALQADLNQHIHEENDILFPRALELESIVSSNA